ncbi:MAG: 4'-phosphopantetheinyl transferase superfamily protein [Ignavibacteria bacterium]|jgi:4'-phosphopantetheinyl transferase|nr:4'-phosphopantetheinyl transferase superfamily protein [Ignavibacteria bacterium]MCU7501440.1 4'-phosphopantetheinyl transferase superfamily protein [Ignavibacteria bacterium]MCU7516044.1 4'-phosphopantetheinyl transferase superfamily protein [Ignavibacteria bacterium]
MQEEKYLLKEDEVHVWHVDAGLVSSSEFWNVLNGEETERARRYHFSKDRENFLVSRGVLRSLIAHYTNNSPENVEFHYNKYGKPFLKGEESLKFNVSHSGRILLFAFARNKELGIDVEQIRHDFAELEIAGSFFSSSEVLQLSVLPEEIRKLAFFKCWTLKEAYIKAKGKGLSVPLDSFDVSVCPEAASEVKELLRVPDDPEESRKWKIFSLSVALGYCAALAVEGEPLEIRHFSWTDEVTSGPSFLGRQKFGCNKPVNSIK